MAATTYRSPGEIAGQYAAVEIARHQTRFRQTVADAVTRTLDWLTGQTDCEPLDGAVLEPTPAAVASVMRRAAEGERFAMETGRDSVWVGKVAHTLSWWRCEPGTEPPLL